MGCPASWNAKVPCSVLEIVATHVNCKYSAVPSVGAISSVCGVPLGLSGTPGIQHVLLCRWLWLREQVQTNSGDHRYRCEPSLALLSISQNLASKMV